MSRREGKKGDRGDMPLSLHGNNWKSSTSLPLTFYRTYPHDHTERAKETSLGRWPSGQLNLLFPWMREQTSGHTGVLVFACHSIFHNSTQVTLPIPIFSFQSWAQSHLLLKTFPDCLQPRATCLLLQPQTVFINNRIAQAGGLYRLEWPVTNLCASFFFLKKIANFLPNFYIGFLEGPSPCCLLFQMPT